MLSDGYKYSAPPGNSLFTIRDDTQVVPCCPFFTVLAVFNMSSNIFYRSPLNKKMPPLRGRWIIMLSDGY